MSYNCADQFDSRCGELVSGFDGYVRIYTDGSKDGSM